MDIIALSVPITCSIAFMISFYLGSHVISHTVFKTYTQLAREEQAEWNSRVLSTVHAIISVVGAVYCTVLDEQCRSDVAFGYSIACDWVISFTLGYWIFDFLLMIRYYDQLGNTALLLHHVYSIIPFSFGRLYKQLYFYGTMPAINVMNSECWTLTTELSTPFVNVKWFLTEETKRNAIVSLSASKLQWQNGIGLWISFLLCRIINLALLLRHMHTHIDITDPLVYGPVLFGTMISTVLSYIWFWKISLGLLSRLSKKVL